MPVVNLYLRKDVVDQLEVLRAKTPGKSLGILINEILEKMLSKKSLKEVRA